MSKKKTGTLEVVPTKELEIIKAGIKDDFCNYSYEDLSGNIGDVHNVTGSGIVDQDMIEAFRKLNVHLATIDDVFKHKGVDIKDIDKMHNHELTANYTVTGFSVKGSDENMTVSLQGNKHVSLAAGRIDLKTPPVALDKFSSYKWWNELKEAIEVCRHEVIEYKNGKYTKVEEVEKIDKNQLKLTDGMEDFEKASV